MKRSLMFAVVTSLGMGCAAPPASMMMHPGPGVDGPGPGVIGARGPRQSSGASQVHFGSPESMQIGWQTGPMGGSGGYASSQITAPGRYNFPQGAVYQLQLTNIPDRPGVVLYPTLEVASSNPKTSAYLAHNTVPVQFSDEDFDQVLSGNMVTKVIYLPDPLHQELAIAGVETLVSTRLEPGLDPVAEANRRGTILAVVRMGGIDRSLPGAPTVSAGSAIPGARGGSGAIAAGSWGMPMTGTPIGLPGPPHLPLGGPAGLQRHVIRNHTLQHYPKPVGTFTVDVRHSPGMSLPAPVRGVSISETVLHH